MITDAVLPETTKKDVNTSDDVGTIPKGPAGEPDILLSDCLISEYHVVGDMDIGEVNMNGIFLGRDLEEMTESMKSGEIIQL